MIYFTGILHIQHLISANQLKSARISVIGMWAKEDGAIIDTDNDGIDDRVDRLFTGQMYDKESGLYYMNARYYDPDIGTFMNPDPSMSSLNHYAYASANPIKYTDPTGMDDENGGTWDNSEANAIAAANPSEPSQGSCNADDFMGDFPDEPTPEINWDDVLGPNKDEQDYNDMIAAASKAQLAEKASVQNQSSVKTNNKTTDYVNGYQGLKGFIMTIAEIARHSKVMNDIKEWNPIIEKYSKANKVDPNLVRAIIYEEQTHNKTPWGEWIPGVFINSVGPMAVHKTHWDEFGYNRWQMMNPEINIKVGTALLSQAINRLGSDYSIQNAAAMYNSGALNLSSLRENSILYGSRVEDFYNFVISPHTWR